MRLLNISYCGASLVEVDGIQFALTAAYCIGDWNFNPSFYNFVAGDLSHNITSGLEQEVLARRILVHPEYNNVTFENDIAIILLNGTFTLNENVQTVKLPTQGQVISRGNLTVSGWGRLESSEPYSDDLHIADIPLVNDTYCQQAYQNEDRHVVDSMICAGSRTGDISPCAGDYGGPAVSEDGFLTGISSWWHNCGHPDYPAVFTKVSYFINWIEATVQKYKTDS